MKKDILALCDTDTAYLYRLAEYMEEKSRQPFQICCFTGLEQINRFCREKEIKILLIAETLYTEELKKLPVGQIVVLNETGRAVDEELKNIGKYQSSEIIYRELAEEYTGMAQESGGGFFPSGKMKIIGNYSPVRRCLQTTFALTMGQLLAKYNKTLYLNFESYSGFSYLFNREFTADMSDALYFFRCEKDRLALRLNGMTQSVNGLDIIPPLLSYQDMNTITGEQWVKFFGEIERAAGYDYLILDLSEQMQGLFDILQECHKVYTITGQDSFADAKMKQYERMLQMKEYEEVERKTRKCSLPIFRGLPCGLEHLTHGELASYVSGIMEEDKIGIAGKPEKEMERTASWAN